MRRNPLHHLKIGADAFHPSAVLRGLGQARQVWSARNQVFPQAQSL